MTDGFGQDVHQLGWRIRATVGQRVLQVVPDAFIRVQLGCVWGKGLYVQTRGTGEQFVDGIIAMGCAIIQKHHQMAGDLTQQMTKASHYFFALNIVLVQVTVPRTMEAFRADGNTRNGRDPVVPIPMMDHRRLADRAPRLPNRRDQEEPRFVHQDEVGCQPCGVFFTRGQTDCFHSAMTASLRSMARRSGFWWLQPSWWRSFPT